MPVFRMLPWKPIIAALPVVLNNSKLRSPIRPSLRLTGQLKLLRCKILLTTQYNHCEEPRQGRHDKAFSKLLRDGFPKARNDVLDLIQFHQDAGCAFRMDKNVSLSI